MYKVYVGSDHAGFQAKQDILLLLKELNYSFEDVGCYTQETCDYPDFARLVGKKVNEDSNNSIGILLCGTGVGMAIAANRFPNVRATLVHSVYLAEMAKKHGNCNVICLGTRVHTVNELKIFVRVFLTTQFEYGRHRQRIEKLSTLV